MSRKGKLAEILSKAQYADDPTSYTVGYLDYNIIKEITLSEFIRESDNFETIPVTRIQFVKKENRILFSRTKQQVN
jgi:hypothetical protein